MRGVLVPVAALWLLAGCPVRTPEPPTSTTGGFVTWPEGCPGGLSCAADAGCAEGLSEGPHGLCTVDCESSRDCIPSWAGDSCVEPVGGFGPGKCGVPCATTSDCKRLEPNVPDVECVPVGSPAVHVCGLPWSEPSADVTGAS